MSYYGGYYKMTNMVRKFRFKDNNGDMSENIRAPLFEERSEEIKLYGTPEPNNSNKGSLGRRLEKRRSLVKLRRRVINTVCFIALVGIVLMMIENELYILHYTKKTQATSNILKSCISTSTILLLLGLCMNYYIDLRIKALDTGVKDWQSVISDSTIFCFIIEITACSIHPFPGNLTVTYTTDLGEAKQVSIDAFLSILMMMRLYLLVKFTVANSHLVTDTSANSIGALSKIKINSLFVFKAVMSKSPGRLLVCVMVTTFLVNSWAMRTCECYYLGQGAQNSYMEVMWLIATTFLTVGYGDKIPQSYCGRYISICTGIIGVGTSALMVAVLARKLEQTRLERYVFNMVIRIQIEKKRKNAAANVIKSVFHLWQLRKYSVNDKKLRRKYMDNLKTAINELRVARTKKAHIDDCNVGLLEISEAINDIERTVTRIEHYQCCEDQQRGLFENRLHNLERKLDDIRDILVSKRSK